MGLCCMHRDRRPRRPGTAVGRLFEQPRTRSINSINSITQRVYSVHAQFSLAPLEPRLEHRREALHGEGHREAVVDPGDLASGHVCDGLQHHKLGGGCGGAAAGVSRAAGAAAAAIDFRRPQ